MTVRVFKIHHVYSIFSLIILILSERFFLGSGTHAAAERLFHVGSPRLWQVLTQVFGMRGVASLPGKRMRLSQFI